MSAAVRFSHYIRASGRTIAVFVVINRRKARLPKTGWADAMLENLSNEQPFARDTAAAAGFDLRGTYGTGSA